MLLLYCKQAFSYSRRREASVLFFRHFGKDFIIPGCIVFAVQFVVSFCFSDLLYYLDGTRLNSVFYYDGIVATAVAESIIITFRVLLYIWKNWPVKSKAFYGYGHYFVLQFRMFAIIAIPLRVKIGWSASASLDNILSCISASPDRISSIAGFIRGLMSLIFI